MGDQDRDTAQAAQNKKPVIDLVIDTVIITLILGICITLSPSSEKVRGRGLVALCVGMVVIVLMLQVCDVEDVFKVVVSGAIFQLMGRMVGGAVGSEKTTT